MRRTMFAAMLSACCAVCGAGRAYLGVKVIDSDTGITIPNLKVHGGFGNSSPGWGIAGKDNNDEALTDINGFCRLSGCTDTGESSCIVRGNNGYYDSGWYSFDYTERSLLKFGRWLPDNVVVTVRLDRVVNPVPLYVKYALVEHRARSRSYYEVCQRRKNLNLAATNEVPTLKNVKLVYDLLEGAWLPPHGNGTTADIEFSFNEEILGWKESVYPGGVALDKKYRTTVSITMPGEGNGLAEIVPSVNAGIKLRTAPAEGYVNNLTRWRGWFGGGDGIKSDYDKSRCHAFRIRTVYDKDGKVKSAYYGKIYGDFNVVDFEGVSFLYYLNPVPNDRNLEWDTKNNLCPQPGGTWVPEP